MALSTSFASVVRMVQDSITTPAGLVQLSHKPANANGLVARLVPDLIRIDRVPHDGDSGQPGNDTGSAGDEDGTAGTGCGNGRLTGYIAGAVQVFLESKRDQAATGFGFGDRESHEIMGLQARHSTQLE